MIHYNSKDKLLPELLSPLQNLKLVQEIKNAKTLNVYGIGSAREIDVAIPEEMPIKEKSLLKSFIQGKGLTFDKKCYWDLAESYNFQVLGLGYKLRKTNPELCKRVVICTYLALNNKIKFL